MSLLHLLILAFLQGITEFLPISSSAHLAVLPAFASFPDQGQLMDVSVHVGTLLAVMIYFRRDVGALACGGLAAVGLKKGCQPQANLFRLLVLASLPVLIVGGLLAVSGYADVLRRLDVIAAASIGFGVLLYWADQKGAVTKRFDDLKNRPAILIGLAQVLSLIPGTSRSGITMTAGRMLGFGRVDAARFSLLLSIPTILAAGAWSTFELVKGGAQGELSQAAFAAFVAFLTALGAIHFLMRWLARANMTIFAVYRVLFGVAIIIWLL